MNETNDAEAQPRYTAAPVPATAPVPQTPASPTAARRVLVVDADRALFGLLEEWLAGAGCVAVADAGCVPVAGRACNAERFDAVIVDVAFPRNGGVDSVARIVATHPSTPILAMSPTFFAGIECCGAVAHRLGVSCVLPNPASREALVGALARCWARTDPPQDTTRR